MKHEEHGERVKRTFMQSAQVLSVHSSYPPVLDGAKAVKRDSGVDFLELKSYKQWKPVDGEGTSKKITEGVKRSFDLIKNAIESTFGMKPQARVVLLDLVTEFKMLFHELFAMEVNLFYETTLNKVGGEHPSEASKIQCWALVTKLLKTIFQATHKARRFATEAGGPDMDPLRANGYFSMWPWRSCVSSRSSPGSNGGIMRNSGTTCWDLSSRIASRRLFWMLNLTRSSRSSGWRGS